jgi:hypothetical protein
MCLSLCGGKSQTHSKITIRIRSFLVLMKACSEIVIIDIVVSFNLISPTYLLNQLLLGTQAM